MKRTFPVLVSASLAVLLLTGCEHEGSREAKVADTMAPPAVRGVPEASFLRFRESRGAGLDRESLEIELFQLKGDVVRVRGSVRVGMASVPVSSTMTATEYAAVWQRVKDLPLDNLRAEEDSRVDPPGWTKTASVDIVIDDTTRLKSSATWKRPLVDESPLLELEARLREVLLAYSEAEIAHIHAEGPGDLPDVGILRDKAIRRAEEALGDALPENLPGGSPE
ncbi:MAG: hypothetical protein QF819_08205 [Gemmatimonadota bacterium]|jgi:hypothetical protein|nr:hypothetical protein [Gemmatimonadota bacterium]MDP6529637.1 hypothetical protein [Gemmatimonadota bacterium]MDP6803141.1 hypothetical protein [Gemmatimonadota bacterium]MDP7030690.1 hypothetical protein [Gemmatimonadota bacterium]